MDSRGGFAETFVARTISRETGSRTVAGRSLAERATDLFLIAVRMREAEDLGEPAALRKLIGHYLAEFARDCYAAGISKATIEDARYAVVALLDETVLSVSGPCRDLWLVNPLQLEIYGEAVAGEEFYRRLDRLEEDPEKNRDVLEVYLIALALGFEGKYRLGGGQQRAQRITRLADKIRRHRGSSSGNILLHVRPRSALTPRSVSWPAIWYYGVAIFSAMAVAVTWAVVAIVNSSHSARAAGIIRELFAR